MDPLLPLASLSSDIEHVDTQLSHIKPRLADTRRLRTCSQHIISSGTYSVAPILRMCEKKYVAESIR